MVDHFVNHAFKRFKAIFNELIAEALSGSGFEERRKRDITEKLSKGLFAELFTDEAKEALRDRLAAMPDDKTRQEFIAKGLNEFKTDLTKKISKHLKEEHVMDGLNFTEAAKEAAKEARKSKIKKSDYEAYTSGRLEDHKKFGGDADRSLPKAIEKVKTKDGETKVKTSKSSGLGKKIDRIEEMYEDLERLREREKEPDYQDITKGEGKRLAKEIDELEKKLAQEGKRAQKGIAKTLDAFEKRHDAAKKQHRKTVEKLQDTAAEYNKALHPDKAGIDEAGKKLTFKKEIAEPVTVEITTAPGKKGTYTIGKDGTITAAGGALEVTSLTKDHLKDIRKTAHKEVSAHFEKEISAHKDRFAQAEQEAKAVREHFKDNLGKKVSDKTKVGEWDGKKSSVATVGGSKAADLGVIGKRGWEKAEKEILGTTRAAATATWRQASGLGKVVRGTISLGGLYVTLTSGFDLAKHALGGTKKDDAGNDIPTTGSDLVVDAAKLVAGAGAVYLALIYKGKNKAINAPSLSA